MTHYTVCCGYASHYHNTVTLEADTLDEALEKAIEHAGDDPHWKSADYCGPTIGDAIAEGEDADPWGDTAIPIPDRFTQNGEPPVVTLTGPRPPGGIEVAGSTVRIRIVEHAGTVTTEAADPPAPPGNKPLVTVRRRADGAPDVAVSGGHARVFILDPGDTGPPPAFVHRKPASSRYSGPGALFRPGADSRRAVITIIDIREDHSHETAYRRTAHEAACKWDPKRGRPRARGQVV